MFSGAKGAVVNGGITGALALGAKFDNVPEDLTDAQAEALFDDYVPPDGLALRIDTASEALRGAGISPLFAAAMKAKEDPKIGQNFAFATLPSPFVSGAPEVSSVGETMLASGAAATGVGADSAALKLLSLALAKPNRARALREALIEATGLAYDDWVRMMIAEEDLIKAERPEDARFALNEILSGPHELECGIAIAEALAFLGERERAIGILNGVIEGRMRTCLSADWTLGDQAEPSVNAVLRATAAMERLGEKKTVRDMLMELEQKAQGETPLLAIASAYADNGDPESALRLLSNRELRIGSNIKRKAILLGRIGGEAAKRELPGMLSEIDDYKIAAFELGRLGDVPPQEVTAHRGNGLVSSYVDGLVANGGEAALENLRAMKETETVGTRLEVVGALIKFGKIEEARALLEEILQGAEEQIFLPTVFKLWAMLGERERALEIAERETERSDYIKTSLGFAGTWFRLGDSDRAFKILQKAQLGKERELEAALMEIAGVGGDGVMKFFRRISRKGSDVVRMEAAYVLGKMGGDEPKALLRGLMENKTDFVRHWAGRALIGSDPDWSREKFEESLMLLKALYSAMPKNAAASSEEE